jgi:hypothetical protein
MVSEHDTTSRVLAAKQSSQLVQVDHTSPKRAVARRRLPAQVPSSASTLGC